MMDIDLRPIEIISDEHREALLGLADLLDRCASTWPVDRTGVEDVAERLRAIVADITADMDEEAD